MSSKATTCSVSTFRDLRLRAKKTKTKLDWGRSDGSALAPSRLQIAEKTIDYSSFTVGGRHFVDTFLLAQLYDVGMRSLAGFERTDVAGISILCGRAMKSSALTGKGIMACVPGQFGNNLPASRAVRWARDTGIIPAVKRESPSSRRRFFPYHYQDVIVRGNATRINALLLPEFFGNAIPFPSCHDASV